MRYSGLFLQTHDLAGVVGDVLDAGRQSGSTVKALQQSAITQLIDIPSDGLSGNPKVLGKRFNGDEPLPRDEFENASLALV